MGENELNKQTKPVLPNLILTASGPGELAGWVGPLLAEIRRQEKPWRVSLVVWKTPFSAGSERRVQSLLPGLDAVVTIRSNGKVLFNRQVLSRLVETGTPRALLHLGGGTLLSRFLSMRLRCPAFLYSENGRSWRTLGFQKVFLSEKATSGVSQAARQIRGRYEVVGDLFVDASTGRPSRTNQNAGDSNRGKVTIGFFPGSRPYQIQYMGPVFLILCKRIARKVPDAEFMFAKSEHLSLQAFLRLATRSSGSLSNRRKTSRFSQQAPSNSEKILEPNIPVLSSREVLARSDMVVMLPGTATAEAMLMGVPMIVLAPYYRLASNPSPGVPPGVDAILGLLGRCIKQKILLAVLRRFTFFSHPNLKAGREIVPELRGWIRPSQIVQTVVEMAKNERWRSRISNELKRLSGPAGASKRIIETLGPFMK